MPSIRGRIVFDIALSALLVFEMLYQFTGNALHEIVGAAFFACIVVHLGFAAKWIGSFARAVGAGTVARRQRRLGIVAGLLALDVVLLGFSSVVISQSLWDAGIDLSFLNPGNIWYPVHTVTAYALSILVIGHLVMHWANVADALKIAYDPTRREAISSALNGVVMVGGIALGVVGLMQAGRQASDFAVKEQGDEESPAVKQGYREVNAQTGEYTEDHSFEAASLTDDGAGQTAETAKLAESEQDICPICPRRCKLSAPRCERPYEAGLIS